MRSTGLAAAGWPVWREGGRGWPLWRGRRGWPVAVETFSPPIEPRLDSQKFHRTNFNYCDADADKNHVCLIMMVLCSIKYAAFTQSLRNWLRSFAWSQICWLKICNIHKRKKIKTFFQARVTQLYIFEQSFYFWIENHLYQMQTWKRRTAESTNNKDLWRALQDKYGNFLPFP